MMMDYRAVVVISVVVIVVVKVVALNQLIQELQSKNYAQFGVYNINLDI